MRNGLNPPSIAAAMEADDLWPEWSEAFGYVHPQIEWQTVFLRRTHRGHLECAAAWDDFLKWAGDYRPSLDELADLGGEHVYIAIALAGAGKSSAVQMDARFFDVFTVRDGLILRIAEYTDRPEALAAVGLSE